MIDVMTIMIDDFDDYDDGEDIDKQHQVAIADNFSYVDPVDGSKAAKQGIRVNTIITTTTTTTTIIILCRYMKRPVMSCPGLYDPTNIMDANTLSRFITLCFDS